MADKTIESLHGVRAQDAHKPFFVYFSTGCSHAPPRDEGVGYKLQRQVRPGVGQAAGGTFARQKARCRRIPADAELTARNEAFPAWDDVPGH